MTSPRLHIGVTRKAGWLLAAVLAPRLMALNPNLAIHQYLHTSWSQEEGNALPPIQALAQTADGYLWLGWNQGLMRFDGMRFTDWSPVSATALPSRNIGWLRPASGGGLWVGTAAGLCRIDGGRVTCSATAEKLPCPAVVSMIEDRSSGRLWLLNECPSGNTLAMVSPDGHLRIFGAGDGLPAKPPQALFQDSRGHLWIATSDAVCRWEPGSEAACSKGPALDVTAMAEDGEGRMVVVDDKKKQVFRLTDQLAVSAGPSIPDLALSRSMLCDRDGNIWIGTIGQGLLRVGKNGVDRFTRSEGLSNNSVSAIVEDREGDIWVATARGVDRIRDPKVELYSTLNGLSSDLIDTVSGTLDGAVWIGTTGGGVDRLAEKRVTVFSRASGLPDPTVLSIYAGSTGSLWVATGGGLAVQGGDRFTEVLTADGRHLKRVFNIGGDASGAVWAADLQLGLFAVHGGIARAVPVSMRPGDAITSLVVARNGAVWLGHYLGGITVLCGDSAARYFDTREGLGAGTIRALYEDRDGTIWAGTGDGLSRFRHSHWTSWTSAQGLPEGGVQGIADDEECCLWLATPTAVVRLLRSALEGSAKILHPLSYTRSDGLRMGKGMSNPRLTRSRDGRIWVCTEDGVAAIDPPRVKSNPIPPPVVIEQVIADGKPADPALPGETALRVHDLQIVYTGISLMAPEQVRFRYRMQPLDKQWTDAGTRRNVTYMNLPPGHYHFQVRASNNDGLWNNAGADFAWRVDPYFYQTKWFLALCLTVALMLVWLAHRLKVRSVVSRLELIAAERVRFSRELHDSLLQGFSGVVFLLEAAARQFQTAPELSKQRLDRALDQADQSLREAREMIGTMRIPALESHTLPEALRTTVGQMTSGIEVEFQFDIKGRMQQAPYNVEANLFLLAREAVTNSLNHASAGRIRLELCYTPKELHLTVQDNGTGFDPEMAMSKAGHWGFRGMRERARAIHATFAVDSAPGRGTTIEVSAPWKKK